ncbi:MAG TPA: metallophosphoesterase family protein [Acidimicrobiales bacterium]|nr:metallophosphoesterase family protein [Acidimicrobiales bacterium]
MIVAVVADTHLRAGRTRRLPEAAVEVMKGADAILHAGDFVDRDALDEMSSLGPLHGVLGNNDHTLAGVLPATRRLELEAVRVGMVHDSGPRKGREARMRRMFPDADVVVFGHSHIPVDAVGVDGQILFNPGSPTERRSQPERTVGVLELSHGRVVGRRHVVV